MHPSLEKLYGLILEADKVLERVVYRTPVDRSRTLSNITEGEVYLKLENLQRTGSFKIRGAYYFLWSILRKRCNVKLCVAASSGNHAQGVALAASELGMKSIIVMPERTPYVKVNATRSYGAKVVLHGSTYDDAYSKAMDIKDKFNAVFVHPFNDERIIAGQGTIGLEIVRKLGDLDVVLVPVGGGGLISGIAIAVKKLIPHAKIIGVQPEGAPAMALSFKEGKLIEVKRVNTIADGVAVKKPGELTFNIIKEVVDDIVLVSEEDIVQALFLLLERSKCVAEPAGALSVAALIGNKVDLKGKRAVAVISGGNIEMSMLARLIDKAMFLEGRLVRICGELPDRPGMLMKVLKILAALKANIVEISHDRLGPYLKPGKARVYVTFEVKDERDLKKILRKLEEKGFVFTVAGSSPT